MVWKNFEPKETGRRKRLKTSQQKSGARAKKNARSTQVPVFSA